jgi:hypothetical protein
MSHAPAPTTNSEQLKSINSSTPPRIHQIVLEGRFGSATIMLYHHTQFLFSVTRILAPNSCTKGAYKALQVSSAYIKQSVHIKSNVRV